MGVRTGFKVWLTLRLGPRIIDPANEQDRDMFEMEPGMTAVDLATTLTEIANAYGLHDTLDTSEMDLENFTFDVKACNIEDVSRNA